MTRSRRNEPSIVDGLFDLLVSVPVWVGPVLAAVVFALLRWVVPTILGGSTELGGIAGGITTVFATVAAGAAPWVSVGILLVWVWAEIQKRVNGMRFDRQTGTQSIRQLGWQEFEALLSEAFRRQGFAVEHTGGPQPDGGVDQRLTKAGAVTLVQCKHWKSRRVGVGVVRELLGVVASERAQSGIVVTSGTFTPDASAFAARNPIRLISGEELVAMIGDVQKSGRIASGAPPAATPRTSSSASAASATAAIASEVQCPDCGAAMVRRVAKRGQNAGGAFMGCTRYPQCRGTRPLK